MATRSIGSDPWMHQQKVVLPEGNGSRTWLTLDSRCPVFETEPASRQKETQGVTVMKRSIPLSRRKVQPTFNVSDLLKYIGDCEANLDSEAKTGDGQSPLASAQRAKLLKDGIKVPDAWNAYNDSEHCTVEELVDALATLQHFALTGELPKSKSFGFLQWLEENPSSKALADKAVQSVLANAGKSTGKELQPLSVR